MSLTFDDTHRSWFGRLVAWFRAASAMPLSVDVGTREASRIAAEAGMSVPELDRVNRAGVEAAYPMYKRLDSLGLDQAELSRNEPLVLNDLVRVCSFCPDGGQCRDELKHDPNGKHWQSYCPNMGTFNALQPLTHGERKD